MIEFLYLSIMSIVDIFMESFVKLYTLHNKNNYMIFAIMIYTLQPILFSKLLRYNNSIGISNILWNVTSSIIILIFGVYKFNEKFSRKHIIGIILGIISLILLQN